MPARMMLSVKLVVTLDPSGNPAAVGKTTELLIEPRSIYRYSILPLQLLANPHSTPPPTVQPNRSVLLDPPKASGEPFAVTVARFRSVCTLPQAPPPVA